MSLDAVQLIEMPIDFGSTARGRLQPAWAEPAVNVLAAAWVEAGGKRGRQPIRIPITRPENDTTWDAPMKFDAELDVVVRRGAEAVQEAVRKGFLPVVFGGDHTVSLATAIGLSRALPSDEKLGAIIWDAHTDFNLPGPVAEVPERVPPGKTISGNAHGMINALLAGLADQRFQLARTCKEQSRVDPKRVVILGARTKRYPQLEETLAKAGPLIISADEIRRAGNRGELWERALKTASGDCQAPYYLSLDADVFEPKLFPWVETPVADGLSFDDFEEFATATRRFQGMHRWLRALELSEFTASAQAAYQEPIRRIIRALQSLIVHLPDSVSGTVF